MLYMKFDGIDLYSLLSWFRNMLNGGRNSRNGRDFWGVHICLSWKWVWPITCCFRLCFSNNRGVLALVFMCLCFSVWRKTRKKADSISIFFLCGFEETNWGRNFSVGNQTWIGTGHCNVVVAGQPMYGIKSDDRNELFKRILMWNTWPSVLYNDTTIHNRLFLKLHFPSFLLINRNVT